MAVGYEGELQLSQFEIMGTEYRSCHCDHDDDDDDDINDNDDDDDNDNDDDDDDDLIFLICHILMRNIVIDTITINIFKHCRKEH